MVQVHEGINGAVEEAAGQSVRSAHQLVLERFGHCRVTRIATAAVITAKGPDHDRGSVGALQESPQAIPSRPLR